MSYLYVDGRASALSAAPARAGVGNSPTSPSTKVTTAPSVKRREPQTEPEPPATLTERVLRSFNTWAFKREQPSDLALMWHCLANVVRIRQPVPFVLYWGRGPRQEPGRPEAQTLSYLDSMFSRVKACYSPGVAATLIFTDTHAKLNGYDSTTTQRYFDATATLAASRGISSCLMSSVLHSVPEQVVPPGAEHVVPENVLAYLRASARKWYHGEGSSDEGALKYLRMNLIEQRAVEAAFPQTIFITFNGSNLRALFPRGLPIFYMYSLRRGFGIKPWFLPAEPQLGS
jgi:L-tyrosine isonitrile synthase